MLKVTSSEVGNLSQVLSVRTGPNVTVLPASGAIVWGNGPASIDDDSTPVGSKQ